MKKLITRLQELPEPKQTYLEILRVHQQEVPLANLLAFFFRPTEKHALDNLFLEALLGTECASIIKGVENTDTPETVSANAYFNGKKTEVDFFKIENVKVRTEVKVVGDKRIDILIETKDFVVCIEFKINHDLDNPLQAYQDFVETKYKNKRHIFLVLAPYRKTPIGLAKRYLEQGNIKFKLVILSHFFKGLNLKESTSNKYQEYFNDLVQTVKNREIRHKRDGLLRKIGDHLKPEMQWEFISNASGGYLQFAIKDGFVKFRVEKDGYRLDKCGRDYKVFDKKYLSYATDINKLKQEIALAGVSVEPYP